MLHPDVFGACASSSGTFRLRPETGMGGVFGDGPEGERLRDAASPALLAPAHVATLRGQAIAFDCGLDDESLVDNRAFHRLLDTLAVPHDYREYPGGHGWDYWRARLPAMLEQVTARMRR
jgi:enterochelin esterase-like enzyme